MCSKAFSSFHIHMVTEDISPLRHFHGDLRHGASPSIHHSPLLTLIPDPHLSGYWTSASFMTASQACSGKAMLQSMLRLHLALLQSMLRFHLALLQSMLRFQLALLQSMLRLTPPFLSAMTAWLIGWLLLNDALWHRPREVNRAELLMEFACFRNNRFVSWRKIVKQLQVNWWKRTPVWFNQG